MIYNDNMSYGATVGASAANGNLIKLKTKFLPLSWINPVYTATFQSGLLTIKKLLMNLNCLFVVDI